VAQNRHFSLCGKLQDRINGIQAPSFVPTRDPEFDADHAGTLKPFLQDIPGFWVVGIDVYQPEYKTWVTIYKAIDLLVPTPDLIHRGIGDHVAVAD
jgi:hypothetical protein